MIYHCLLLHVMLSGAFFQPVSRRDLALEVGFQALAVVDVMQTSYAMYHINSPDMQETNFVLGEHPSPSRLVLTAGAGMLLHALILWAIPPEFRPWWVAYTGAIEVVTVGLNFYEVGFHLALPF